MLSAAFDLKSGQLILLALLVMIGAFYSGTFFGNNSAIYVPQFTSNSSLYLSPAVSSSGKSCCKVWFGWVRGRSVFDGFGLFDWISLVGLQGLRDSPTGSLLLIEKRRFWYRNLGWMYVHWSLMNIYLVTMCLTLIPCGQVWIFPGGKSWRGTVLRLRSDCFAWFLRPRIISYP